MTLPLVLAAESPLDLAALPWSFLMAFASLGLIYWVFRRRSDLLEDVGFSGKEVAILSLGSIAGWAVNLPLAVLGSTYLAVNVGGTLVPLLLIAGWVRKRKLRIVPAIVGAGLVALVAWRIVEFRPDSGIVARYPTFFLPVLVAFAFSLLVSVRRPLTSVPLAYATGTVGALVGADLLRVHEIRAHFLSAPDKTIISIGGAGVFDMVFLAGTFAMALNLALIATFRRRVAREPRVASYPAQPVAIEDAHGLWTRFQGLAQPNALERAYAGVALSDLALCSGDYARSVRMSWLAVDSLLRVDTVRAYVSNGVDAALKRDLDALNQQYLDARASAPRLRHAGDANLAAKTLVASLAPRSGLSQAVEVGLA